MSGPGTIPPKKEGLVTAQERLALILILLGVASLAFAAYAQWGWPAALMVLSGLVIAAGVLVGLIAEDQ